MFELFDRECTMRRLLILTLSIGLVVLTLWELVPLQVVYWDGGFELTVNLLNESPNVIRKVNLEVTADKSNAEAIVKFWRGPDTNRYSLSVEPFVGGPLIIRVPQSGRRSPLGRELERFQFQYLVVIVEFENGELASKVVEIPDSRALRSVAVQVP